MTETSSAPFQTLITFSLTRSLLHHQLCGPRVLFRTINLVLFALVKITHPDTCWEGLMTVPVERLLLPTRSDSFSFMCSFLFSMHLLYLTYKQATPIIQSHIWVQTQTIPLSCCPLNLLTLLYKYQN